MAVDISQEDLISRCIIYSRFFKEQCHVDSMLWAFGKSGDDGASRESGILRRLAPSEQEVHIIGCGIAEKQNADRNNPPSGSGRRYYCGFRSAVMGDLPLVGEGYRIVVSIAPENGNPAHLDVALYISVEGRNARATVRTNAGMALAECFGPAVGHVCQCDASDEHHPLHMWGEECLGPGAIVLALPPFERIVGGPS